MVDLKWVREHPEETRAALARRGGDLPAVDDLLQADGERRRLLAEVEEKKAYRNRVSQEIGRARQAGEDVEARMQSMREVGEAIRVLDEQVKTADSRIQELLLQIPNLPNPDIPTGPDETANEEVRRWGEPRRFAFEPLAHWDLGPSLGVLDFERAAKIAGARFPLMRGAGAQLERALISFMLDLHTREHGYTEVLPPFLVNREAMVGTGQLPKFAEDVFHCEGTDYYLIPTAEVPVTNLHREEILAPDELPIYYAAYSACFRAEAGSAGRDTRGLIRNHQFDKVELVKLVRPETSYDELEKLVRDAEDVLQRLGLPYRVVCLSSGDLGFSAAKTYDLEVWMPSYGRYVEISSCSNFEAFQARRAQIRFRPEPKAKPDYVHTLNGSGLAVGRTLAALLETFQEADGSVRIPEVLRPYMGGVDVISAGRL
ncbi:serine--tRNA ligase [Limnochorda pilosa]|uniref:Serine--tRNA ligase n=1 Tax=Limnochorda pilosa TaxID=1555112 RepID=A0A0K2SFL6_LIMPI|nr:serine--tRNA ligase [Limnochorda pilosa]BAS25880.1 seryl-tRNA synthetase [Limnochorda pilosa]